MKIPICTFDAKTGTLCAKCESKLKLGQLKQADVEGAIKLTKLADRNQDVNKFTMIGAARVDGDFVLILRGSDISVLRSNTMLPTKFEHEFQSKVWFVEAEATDKTRPSRVWTAVASPDSFECPIPAGLVEEVNDRVQESGNSLGEFSLRVLALRGFERPVDEHRPADHMFLGDEAPVAAVQAHVAVVSHPEVALGGHYDVAVFDVRVHRQLPIVQDIGVFLRPHGREVVAIRLVDVPWK